MILKEKNGAKVVPSTINLCSNIRNCTADYVCDVTKINEVIEEIRHQKSQLAQNSVNLLETVKGLKLQVAYIFNMYRGINPMVFLFNFEQGNEVLSVTDDVEIDEEDMFSYDEIFNEFFSSSIAKLLFGKGSPAPDLTCYILYDLFEQNVKHLRAIKNSIVKNKKSPTYKKLEDMIELQLEMVEAAEVGKNEFTNYIEGLKILGRDDIVVEQYINGKFEVIS